MTHKQMTLSIASTLALLLVAATGCEEYIDLRADGGSQLEAGPRPDFGVVTPCQGKVDVSADAKGSLPLMMQGSVTLPASAAVNSLVSIFVVPGQKAGMQGFTISGTQVVQQAADTFSFRITNVSPGSYTVYMQVDINGGGTGAGDYAGFYKGAVAAPMQDGLTATVIDLTKDSRCDLDFGIDVIP